MSLENKETGTRKIDAAPEVKQPFGVRANPVGTGAGQVILMHLFIS